MNDKTSITRQHVRLPNTHHASMPVPIEYTGGHSPADQVDAASLRSGPLWRLQRVLEYTSISKSQWYRLMAAGDAPLPVHLSERSRAWYSSEIMAWAASRAKGRAA